jgi:ATP-binding cassette subfamily B protein
MSESRPKHVTVSRQGTAKNGQNFLTTRELYFSFIGEHRWIYVLGILTVLITNLTEVMIPRLIQWSIDIVIGKESNSLPKIFVSSQPKESLDRVCIGFYTIMAIGWLMRVLWRQLLARRTHVGGQVLRSRLWDVFRLMPLKTFERFSLGDMINRSTSDVNASRFILGFTLVQSSDIVFFTFLSLIMMFSIDWQLALLCFLVFPIIPFFVVPLSREEYKLHSWAQEKLSSLSDLMTQSLLVVKLQRATALETIWNNKLDEEAKEYTKRRFEVIKTGWKIFPYGASPTIIAYGILITVGVPRIQAGTLSIGEFLAMLSYVLMLQQPLFEMSDCIAEWQKGLSSLHRVVEMLNISPAASHLIPRVEAARSQEAIEAPMLTIKDLNFSFDVNGRAVLRDINLDVNRGGSIGITGTIGSGKTTLLSIISGMEMDYRGQVKIFGHEANKLNRQEISEYVGYVSQTPFLFAGSVRYNLCLDQKFSDEQLWAVLQTVDLAEDFRKSREGLNTRIGEWGINLSGGQRQRMTLARALLRPRPILLLDDCLSAVDAVTEEKILARMHPAVTGQAILWVAHRISTLRLCDQIFILENCELRPFEDGGM